MTKLPAPPTLPFAELNNRNDSELGYAYKLMATGPQASSFGLDVVLSGPLEMDEERMSLWIPFVDGNARDGVGDLLEVGGIDTSRHRLNPIILFDHGKHVQLPIGQAQDPETNEYQVLLDPVSQTGRLQAFFYQGKKDLPGIGKDENYQHAVFCEQLYDLAAKRFIRGGSIGYQVIQAKEIPPDYRRGIRKGLHLIQTKMLEGSLVVLPAHQSTVRKSIDDWNPVEAAREVLCMPSVCGKSLSPYLVKSLAPLTKDSPRTTTTSGFGKPPEHGVEKVGDRYFVTEGGKPKKGEWGEVEGGHLTSGKPHDSRLGAHLSVMRHRGKKGMGGIRAKYKMHRAAKFDHSEESMEPLPKKGKAAPQEYDRGRKPASVYGRARGIPDQEVSTARNMSARKIPDDPGLDEEFPSASARGKAMRKIKKTPKSGTRPPYQHVHKDEGEKALTKDQKQERGYLVDKEGQKVPVYEGQNMTHTQDNKVKVRDQHGTIWGPAHVQDWKLKDITKGEKSILYASAKALKGVGKALQPLKKDDIVRVNVGGRNMPASVHSTQPGGKVRVRVLESGRPMVRHQDDLDRTQKALSSDTQDALAAKTEHRAQRTKGPQSARSGDPVERHAQRAAQRRPNVQKGATDKDLKGAARKVGKVVSESARAVADIATGKNPMERHAPAGTQMPKSKGIVGAVQGAKVGARLGAAGGPVGTAAGAVGGAVAGHKIQDSVTGSKAMNPEALEMEAGGMEDMGMEVLPEKPGATLLRGLFDNLTILLAEYDSVLETQENEIVKNLVFQFLSALEGTLSAIEDTFTTEYPEAEPLGGMDEGVEGEEMVPEPVDVEPGIEESEENDGSDLGTPGEGDEDIYEQEATGNEDMDTMEDPGMGADSADADEPSPEEVLEGMERKMLARGKNLRGKYKAADEIGKDRIKTPTDKTSSRAKTKIARPLNPGVATSGLMAPGMYQRPGKKAMSKCPDCGKSDCACEAVGKVDQKIAPMAAMAIGSAMGSMSKGFKSGDKKVVRGAADWLGEVSKVQSGGWNDESRMKSYHYHKTLDGIVQLEDAQADLANNSEGQVPNADFVPGEGAKAHKVDVVNRPGSSIGSGFEYGAESLRTSPEKPAGQWHVNPKNPKAAAEYRRAGDTTPLSWHAQDDKTKVGGKNMDTKECHPHRSLAMDASSWLENLSRTRSEFGESHRKRSADLFKALDEIANSPDEEEEIDEYEDDGVEDEFVEEFEDEGEDDDNEDDGEIEEAADGDEEDELVGEMGEKAADERQVMRYSTTGGQPSQRLRESKPRGSQTVMQPANRKPVRGRGSSPVGEQSGKGIDSKQKAIEAIRKNMEHNGKILQGMMKTLNAN